MSKFYRTILYFLLSVLFSTVFLQAQSACEETGAITRETYASGILGQTMVYSVYMPPCYDPNQTYPVIYLMHGSNEDDGHWIRLGIQEQLDSQIIIGELPEVIVVLPFGNVIANRNRFDRVSWGNIFMEELLPDAETKYAIAQDGNQRAIGGISRGGFWAYSIGLRHPDMFSAIGGHSGFFDLYHAPDEFNPLALILSAPEIEAMRFYIDRGADDFAFEGLDIMGERMAERGLNFEYIVRPEGIHYNSYWRQHISEYLDFYTMGWQADESDQVANPTPMPFVFATNTPSSVVTPTELTNPPSSDDMPAATIPATQVSASSKSVELYLPVVSFPSLQTTLTSDELEAILRGELDERLVVDTATFNQLTELGIQLHPQTRLVEPDSLFNILWRERNTIALLPFDQLKVRYRVLWLDDQHPINQLDSYPLAFESDSPNFNPEKLTRITLSGVTALTRQTRVALDEWGVEWASEGIVEYVQQSDYFHISNEVSIFPTCPQTNGETLGGTSSMCSKPEHFELLRLLNVDIVELSGNHNNDYGYDAYLNTLAFYRENGMQTVGGGETLAEAQEPLRLIDNENQIAILACNAVGPYYALVNEDAQLAGGVRPGAASCDGDWLQNSIRQLSTSGYQVIVTVQHQEFEEYIPTDTQRFDFRQIADWGANAVLGTSAHKPQIFEFYQTSTGDIAYLHYGMGNLYFDQPFWGNMRFFMNTVMIYDNNLLTIDLFPGIIDDNVRPRLMSLDERLNFLHFMFVQQNGL